MKLSEVKQKWFKYLTDWLFAFGVTFIIFELGIFLVFVIFKSLVLMNIFFTK